MKRHHSLLGIVLAVVLAHGSHAWAQAKPKGKDDDYPNRTVRMIVPFAPGGASDTVGRIIQPAMADLLKQQVVVDNRGGAAGNIGVEVAVHVPRCSASTWIGEPHRSENEVARLSSLSRAASEPPVGATMAVPPLLRPRHPSHPGRPGTLGRPLGFAAPLVLTYERTH